jgi:hypothetical protein
VILYTVISVAHPVIIKMISSQSTRYTIIGIFLIISILSFISIVQVSKAANVVGDNYRNVTLRTTVNITNSRPEVLYITVFQQNNNSLNITLSAGLTRTVTCNVTVRDWNGYNDIVNVNATFWHNDNSTYLGSEDNNTHYTNTNCTNNGDGAGYTASYSCNFPVYYYANNGTWNCNVTAVDTYNTTGTAQNTTVIFPLYALNVTEGIDYGAVAVGDTSLERSANVTNFGNRMINISLEGYGVTRGDGLAMNCTVSGNITVDNERYATSPGVTWPSMTSLTSSAVTVAGLSMPKQTLPGTPIVNATYWQLYIPPNPAGNCTGYIIFQAEVPP